MASSSRACPPQAESWCSRLARRPNVSLIWQATQIAEPARTLDRKCEDCRCPDRTANTRSPYRSRLTKHDGVLAQLKAKPLRGGPNGAGLDLICARHPAHPAGRDEEVAAVEQKGDCSSLTHTFPM